jgi:thiol-disulfide isomerase/thioredoxin
MEKGLGLAGCVFLPDGRRAAGAEVALCTDEDGAVLGRRCFVDRFDTNITAAGDDGTFVLPPVSGAHTLYAASEAGFGEVEIGEGAGPFHLTLASWGSVKGTARAGEKLGLQPAFASFPGRAGLSFDPAVFAATADAGGGFVFLDVPPREVRLCRLVNHTYLAPQFVVVQAGQTAAVHYGGAGRRLAGKFAVPGYGRAIDWTNGPSARLSAIVAPPPVDLSDPDARTRFFQSAEGRVWQRTQRAYGAVLEPDGAFAIEDVESGNYTLAVNVSQPPEEGGEAIAALSTNLTVPGSGASNAPIDLGEFVIPLRKVLKPGDLAPLFEVKTVEGRPLRLADFRGKYVLLDFWATWCGPCLGETPNLKAAYAAYGGDPRFAIIGLSLDKGVAAPKDYARQNEIKWTQGFLGPSSESAVTPLYGVEGIPAIFLIGPDGKIIERDLRGDEIRAAVGRALGSQ